MVSRLLWATQKILGDASSTTSLEQNFKGKIDEAFHKADEKGKKFYAAVSIRPPPGTRPRSSRCSTLTVRGFSTSWPRRKSTKTKKGKASPRSLRKRSGGGSERCDPPGSETDGCPAGNRAPEGETWTLGKTQGEIAKALSTFDQPFNHDGTEATPVTPSRLQGLSFDNAPAISGSRHFFKVGEAGKRPVAYTPHVLLPEDKDICDVDNAKPVKEVQLSQAAGWFFRYSRTACTAFYAGSVAHERGSEHWPVPPPPKPGQEAASNPNKNILVDLNANGGKGAEIPIPGPYDPVPTTDELYMTVPLR